MRQPREPHPKCPVSGQTPREEAINSITHGLGALLSFGGFAVLVVAASITQNIWHIVSCTVFGLSLILMYLASTLYHSAKNSVRKRKLKIFDHAAIYVLIAGSYTPFTLGPLRGPLGWSLFCVIWGLAVCGVIFKFHFTERFELISTFVYIGMGWIAVFALTPLTNSLPPEAIRGLFVGGLCYTFGTFFHLMPKIPYHHGLWHMFVLAGSAFHFFTVLFYVVK